MDIWGKLWDIATGGPGGPARIEVNSYDVGQVTLVWPDGVRLCLYWLDGDWQLSDELNTFVLGQESKVRED